MTLYRMGPDRLERIEESTFAAAKIRERDDLQRLLRDHVEAVAPDTLVISEEFQDWEGSARRIDLLAVDRKANLVVIELKITEDGGHMELQALRYAAMISAMTFEKAVETFGAYLRARGRREDAREQLLRFLRWTTAEEQPFAENVRIVLVSPGFSQEMTTTVLWLQDQGTDIECVRFRPHLLDGTVLADVQRIIPLPEAEQYQVKLRQKALQARAAQRALPSLDEMWEQVGAGRPAEETAAARDIADRTGQMGVKWFANAASLGQVLDLGRGNRYFFFMIRPSGTVDIAFKWLAQRPPFDDEALRLELLRRLNEIPDVSVAADRIGGVPGFPLRLLVDDLARARFCDTWAWAIETIRASVAE